MLKFDLIELSGYRPATIAMRAPKESWHLNDSTFDDGINIGPNDMDLFHRLMDAGDEHRKAIRDINVYLTIDAPMYWWKEFDTYKIGPVRNSTSTMHTIHKKELTRINSFSMEAVNEEVLSASDLHIVDAYISIINNLIKDYNTFVKIDRIKAKAIWEAAIQLLPSSFNMSAVVMMNYETCMKIIKQRKNHKLKEWHTLVDFLMRLPIIKEYFEKKEEFNKKQALEGLTNEILSTYTEKVIRENIKRTKD